MIIEIKTFSAESKTLLKQAIELRLQVFSDELAFDKDIVFDGKDYDAIHYLVLVDNIVASSVRWREIDNGLLIEFLAVLKKFRDIGIGFLLMKNVLKELKPSKLKIYLSATETNKKFFESLNFKVIDQKSKNVDRFHYNMIYNF